MQCPTCGAEAAQNSSFCSHCGARLDAPPDKAPPDNEGPTGAERASRRAGNRGATSVTDETIWEGDYSPRAMIPAFVFGGVLSLVLVAVSILFPPAFWVMLGIPVIWVYLLGSLAYLKLSVKYRLSTFWFFHERGILRRTLDRVEVIDMDDVTVVQGVLDRMLGVGQIRITSSDRSHPELILKGIDNPREVATKIDTARRAERARRGLHIEMV